MTWAQLFLTSDEDVVLLQLVHQDIMGKDGWRTRGGLCQNHQSFLWQGEWKVDHRSAIAQLMALALSGRGQ